MHQGCQKLEFWTSTGHVRTNSRRIPRTARPICRLSWWYGQGVSRTKRGGCGGVAGWKRWVIKLTIMSKVNRRRPCRRPMCVVVRNLHGESSRSAGGLGSQLDYMGPGLGWQQKDRLFRATIVRLIEVTTGPRWDLEPLNS